MAIGYISDHELMKPAPKSPISFYILIQEHANIRNENICVLFESSQLDRILGAEDLYNLVQARTSETPIQSIRQIGTKKYDFSGKQCRYV